MKKLTMDRIKSDARKKRAKMLAKFKRIGCTPKEFAEAHGVSASYIRLELSKARRDCKGEI